MNKIKQFRINIADKLMAWGKRNGLYAIPAVSTVQIRHEILRKPLFTNKEKHIKSVVRKFMVNQPASIHIILEDIKEEHPIEYSIALSEYEVISNETCKS